MKQYRKSDGRNSRYMFRFFGNPLYASNRSDCKEFRHLIAPYANFVNQVSYIFMESFSFFNYLVS